MRHVFSVENHLRDKVQVVGVSVEGVRLGSRQDYRRSDTQDVIAWSYPSGNETRSLCGQRQRRSISYVKRESNRNFLVIKFTTQHVLY